MNRAVAVYQGEQSPDLCCSIFVKSGVKKNSSLNERAARSRHDPSALHPGLNTPLDSGTSAEVGMDLIILALQQNDFS